MILFLLYDLSFHLGRSTLSHIMCILFFYFLIQQIDRFMSVSKLKYYFAVDTTYVAKKLAIVLCPFTHTVSMPCAVCENLPHKDKKVKPIQGQNPSMHAISQ